MKPLFFVLSLIVFFLPVSVKTQTQPVEVVRSDNKIVIEKQVYYIHIVKPGQTLYSISRVYNVPQKEILLENPNTYVGLQPGQALKIPFRPEAEVDEQEVPEVVRDPDFIYHTIEEGQTLFFLSRNYNVEIEEIIRLNPGIDPDNMPINHIVRIPAKRVYITREGFPTEDDNYIHHKVEKGETLYSISRKYDVPEGVISRANEKLIWGLKYGEYIRIPKNFEDFVDMIEHEIERPADAVDEFIPPDVSHADVVDPEIFIDAECSRFEYREFRRPFRVALLLPFYVERNYPVEVPDAVDQDKIAELYPNYVTSVNELYHETIPFLEFYEGALLALDSLKKSGVSVTLTVFDTERNTGRVNEIIRKPEFQNSDLIIGPVYPENLRIVSDWAQRNRVNVVSPMTSRSEFLAGNPYLFQVTPSASAELEQASVFISNFPCSNFVLIHNNDPFERDMVESFKKNIFRHFSYNSDFDNLVFKEILYTSPTVNIEQSLVAGEKNIVIVPSANQAFVSDILMRLNILNRLYDITIFGLNDWQRFQNIEVEYLHNMELHFASPFFIDYNDGNVKRFLREFRRRYKAEPSFYSFQGYDIMFYFLQAMKNYGPEFHDCLPVMRTELLQADFLFRKRDVRNGFENNGISIVKYGKDLNINRLGLNARIP